MFRNTPAHEQRLMNHLPIILPAPEPQKASPAVPKSTSDGAFFTTTTASYSGKWTLEEETYVSALCEEFRAGSLDVPQGKSLRCFLADELGCNAKRISKKYERTGYQGKFQYLDHRTTMTPEDLLQRRAKLQDLKQQFLKSRETLKFVEASRKRTVPTLSPAATGSTGAYGTVVLPEAKKARVSFPTSGIIFPNPIRPITANSAVAADIGLAGSSRLSSLLANPGLSGKVNDLASCGWSSALLGSPGTRLPSSSPETLARAAIIARNRLDLMARASVISALQRAVAGPGSTKTKPATQKSMEMAPNTKKDGGRHALLLQTELATYRSAPINVSVAGLLPFGTGTATTNYSIGK